LIKMVTLCGNLHSSTNVNLFSPCEMNNTLVQNIQWNSGSWYNLFPTRMKNIFSHSLLHKTYVMNWLKHASSYVFGQWTECWILLDLKLSR
jgi:hypothetical protein